MKAKLRSCVSNSPAIHPISSSEFCTELLRIWRPPKPRDKPSHPTKIGLCVSGGPDSMALASLFQQLRGVEIGPTLNLKALIIDHGHRKDSREEAEWVSATLHRLGIESRIIPLLWPKDPTSASLNNFETAARILRYRSLARACVDEGIRHLFLGHHLCDQAETILFRLIRGHGPSLTGLVGMRHITRIPHSTDIFGAFDGSEALPLSRFLNLSLIPSSTTQAHSRNLHQSSASVSRATEDEILISHSGINLCRPLLSFPKSRLVATCEANSVPFVVDRSNFDRTVTKRNAIRWLLANHKLPAALREDSILYLGAAAVRSEERRAERVEELLRATCVDTFDLRSGRVVIRPPTSIVHKHNATEQAAASYVDHLLRCVSPNVRKSESLHDLIGITRWMFPELRETSSFSSDVSLEARSCTAHGGAITRLPYDPAPCWELSRQPLRARENPNGRFTTTTDSSIPEFTERIWSQWTQWDGRYWIRIRTKDPRNFRKYQIRVLNRSDMETLNHLNGDSCVRAEVNLKRTLKEAAPRKVRYTLPVLVKDDRICALPTCNLEWPSTRSPQSERTVDTGDELQWEVRYKDISETLKHLGKQVINPLKPMG